MQRQHHKNIQNFKAELDARDICMKSVYALRYIVAAHESEDTKGVKLGVAMAKLVLSEIDRSTEGDK